LCKLKRNPAARDDVDDGVVDRGVQNDVVECSRIFFDLSLEGQFRALDRDDARIEPAARPHGRSITGVTIVVSGGLWRLVWRTFFLD
jgi:hypothetical protein